MRTFLKANSGMWVVGLIAVGILAVILLRIIHNRKKDRYSDYGFGSCANETGYGHK